MDAKAAKLRSMAPKSERRTVDSSCAAAKKELSPTTEEAAGQACRLVSGGVCRAAGHAQSSVMSDPGNYGMEMLLRTDIEKYCR